MAKDLKISFRVPPPYAKVILDGAFEEETSIHKYARRLLIRQIESTEILQILDLAKEINLRLKAQLN